MFVELYSKIEDYAEDLNRINNFFFFCLIVRLSHVYRRYFDYMCNEFVPWRNNDLSKNDFQTSA